MLTVRVVKILKMSNFGSGCLQLLKADVILASTRENVWDNLAGADLVKVFKTRKQRA